MLSKERFTKHTVLHYVFLSFLMALRCHSPITNTYVLYSIAMVISLQANKLCKMQLEFSPYFSDWWSINGRITMVTFLCVLHFTVALLLAAYWRVYRMTWIKTNVHTYVSQHAWTNYLTSPWPTDDEGSLSATPHSFYPLHSILIGIRRMKVQTNPFDIIIYFDSWR